MDTCVPGPTVGTSPPLIRRSGKGCPPDLHTLRRSYRSERVMKTFVIGFFVGPGSALGFPEFSSVFH